MYAKETPSKHASDLKSVPVDELKKKLGDLLKFIYAALIDIAYGQQT